MAGKWDLEILVFRDFYSTVAMPFPSFLGAGITRVNWEQGVSRILDYSCRNMITIMTY